jgi:hypothetical protein
MTLLAGLRNRKEPFFLSFIKQESLLISVRMTISTPEYRINY